jgi:hypothetical protein
MCFRNSFGVMRVSSAPEHSDYRPVANVSSLSAPYGLAPISARLGVAS